MKTYFVVIFGLTKVVPSRPSLAQVDGRFERDSILGILKNSISFPNSFRVFSKSSKNSSGKGKRMDFFLNFSPSYAWQLLNTCDLCVQGTTPRKTAKTALQLQPFLACYGNRTDKANSSNCLPGKGPTHLYHFEAIRYPLWLTFASSSKSWLKHVKKMT